MYKLLLCWRYLRTRYIALASIISVTLGVATMIVVNAVMAGFTHEMQDRIHGVLADVVFESRNLNEGFFDPAWHMDRIRDVAGDDIEAMTPTVIVPAMLNFEFRNQVVTRPVQLIGIEERSGSVAGEFGKYLQHPENRKELSFDLRESGYDATDHQRVSAAPRPQMAEAGWEHRRRWGEIQRARRQFEEELKRQQAENQKLKAELAKPKDAVATAGPVEPPVAAAIEGTEAAPPANTTADAAQSTEQSPQVATETTADADNPFGSRDTPQHVFDPCTEQATGAVVGIAISCYRAPNGEDGFLLLPGDDITLTFPTVGRPPKGIDDKFTVVDFWESKMSQFDESFVFVPLRKLQELRGMIDPRTNIGFATAIQIKVKPGVDGTQVRDKLRRAFAFEAYNVSTWRDKEGALLAAVQLETAILNILLFLIIAVAGFGILAIFFMIVVEKTRDIGVLKALGASGQGIQGIFLGYGMSLGVVGSGAGLIGGLLFVYYINEIADLLGYLTGQDVFDPAIYYFDKIPAIVYPHTVTWIVLGALTIAVMASILPARRAARLHPVEALRYE